MIPDNFDKLSQTNKLIHFLRSGHATNFLDAFHRYGVQDFRKRLMEIRELGYHLRRTLEQPRVGHFKATMLNPSRETPVVHVYRMVDPLQPGHFVRVVNAPSVFGVSPLRDRLGVVLKITDDHWHVVGDQAGKAFGRFRHKDLRRVGVFRQGQEVLLTDAPFTLVGHDTQADRYFLRNGHVLLSAPCEAFRAAGLPN